MCDVVKSYFTKLFGHENMIQESNLPKFEAVIS